MILQTLPQRLREVNTLFATCHPGNFSFGQSLVLSLFYRDFSDTNILVCEANGLAKESPTELMELSSAIISEADKYLSLDKSGLQTVDFKALFAEHLKPFELRYESEKEIATRLWREYSSMSNRLDFLPLDSAEYNLLDPVCDAKKAEYDASHTRVNLLYNEWQQERERTFCVYCFKPMFLDVLVERLKGIAGSVIADISLAKEDEP